MTKRQNQAPVPARKRVAVICPTIWDADELRLMSRGESYEFIYWPYSALRNSHPAKLWLALTHLRLFFVEKFIEDTVRFFKAHPVDGVIGTDDFLGAVLAAAVAERLELPAPSPQSILTCQHKFYSRVAQKASVSVATPDFDLVNTLNLKDPLCSLTYPFFAKPVRGTLSILAKSVDSTRELRDLTSLSAPDRLLWHLRLRSFNRLLARYTDFERDADYFLGEEILGGLHVSLEGYCSRGQVHVMGILDSYMYEGTNSFKRFEYPSRLPEAVQERMCEVASTLMSAVGFDDGLFEIEMYYDPTADRISIIEVNPRMCVQFADLFEKVDGTNSYELLLAIATGQEPRMKKGQGKYGAAASFVLRTFSTGRVKRAPSEREIASTKSLFPDARIRLFCSQGDKLSGRLRQLHDVSSIRLAAINLGGSDHNDLMARFRSAMKELPLELEPARGFNRLLLEVSEEGGL